MATRLDVLIKVGDKKVGTTKELLLVYQTVKWMEKIECTIVRNQQTRKTIIRLRTKTIHFVSTKGKRLKGIRPLSSSC